ncbi:MAG: indolepyruvate oxidoreductase subunit beta [Bacteroidales bacterium]|jgi:indolepyruvate ferredoxin oxidoreductase beta subunit|nr:indolepyruvate oxidoreductase subunit beta [Bacteroidales bacterium]NCU35919.1 indolepyruvate oxidoreductase subunit beta [Candidatus Falkowbacteria bacterium]MDD2632371.1 indolepyruvate oxidoreductase subunit beta [Bacteroidales bacterium]MDD3526566.1 indolepyruvate oxidoreductase subunit beta [Bacteroidales bacterium]MDD4177559.1 indolepyruvate oxidoreductase subunit beta [Bacteroidales bacterium]
MKKDIILAGVGGQGILSIAACIGLAAVDNGLFLKQAEVHGMSQRGGAVQSNLRLSDKEIASDLIPYGQADLIISVEPLESLRYLPWLRRDGWLITSSNAFVNIPNYPDKEALKAEIKKIKNHIFIDAEAIAKELGSVRSANMVMLGAAAPFLEMPFDEIEKAIAKLFGNKGEAVVELNQKAMKAGYEFSNRAVAGE